jgi:hypothetical protein
MIIGSCAGFAHHPARNQPLLKQNVPQLFPFAGQFAGQLVAQLAPQPE